MSYTEMQLATKSLSHLSYLCDGDVREKHGLSKYHCTPRLLF